MSFPNLLFNRRKIPWKSLRNKPFYIDNVVIFRHVDLRIHVYILLAKEIRIRQKKILKKATLGKARFPFFSQLCIPSELKVTATSDKIRLDNNSSTEVVTDLLQILTY